MANKSCTPRPHVGALALAGCVVVAGCSTAAGTPEIIYITPPPAITPIVIYVTPAPAITPIVIYVTPAPSATPATTPSPRPTSPRARSGTILDFGRYAGSSLGELAIRDPDYLEWLARTSIGRRLQREIEALLAASRPAPRPARTRSRFARGR